MITAPLSSSARRSLERYLRYPLSEAGKGYLAARGLLEVGIDLGFGSVPDSTAREDHRKYAGRLIIPSFSARGTVMDVAFRCIQDHVCKDVKCPKYLFLPGMRKRLFNVAAVQSDAARIHICEGQLNAATLVACGEAAVGCAGAGSWEPHMGRLFRGFERVIVWKDGDDKEPPLDPEGKPRPKGGDLFVGTVRRDIPGVEVIMVAGEDVNSFFVKNGKDALLALLDERDDEDEEDDGEPVHYDDDGVVIPF